jgi:hypothetical protein
VRELSLAGTEAAYLKTELSKAQQELAATRDDRDAKRTQAEEHATQILATKKVGLVTAQRLKALQTKYREGCTTFSRNMSGADADADDTPTGDAPLPLPVSTSAMKLAPTSKPNASTNPVPSPSSAKLLSSPAANHRPSLSDRLEAESSPIDRSRNIWPRQTLILRQRLHLPPHLQARPIRRMHRRRSWLLERTCRLEQVTEGGSSRELSCAHSRS